MHDLYAVMLTFVVGGACVTCVYVRVHLLYSSYPSYSIQQCRVQTPAPCQALQSSRSASNASIKDTLHRLNHIKGTYVVAFSLVAWLMVKMGVCACSRSPVPPCMTTVPNSCHACDIRSPKITFALMIRC